MKYIQLSQGKQAIVDDENYEYLSQWKWYCKAGYAVRNGHYVDRVRQPAILMHRVVNDTPDGLVTDHINRDKLDNRKVNLRDATQHQNTMNRSLSSRNTSGYKGVIWYKRYNRWHVSISIDKKEMHVGYYDELIDAVNAYNQSALKHYGEFAVLQGI